jgi:hypothetical protein
MKHYLTVILSNKTLFAFHGSFIMLQVSNLAKPHSPSLLGPNSGQNNCHLFCSGNELEMLFRNQDYYYKWKTFCKPGKSEEIYNNF